MVPVYGIINHVAYILPCFPSTCYKNTCFHFTIQPYTVTISVIVHDNQKLLREIAKQRG
jgi:hypothetical protein